MKIRDGFVSNSSSSSFVIISRPADISEIDDERVKVGLGQGGEGEVYGRPNEEQIAWMKEHSCYINFDLHYEYIHVGDGSDLSDSDAVFDMSQMAKFLLDPRGSRITAYAKEINYYFPDNLNDFVKKAAPDKWWEEIEN